MPGLIILLIYFSHLVKCQSFMEISLDKPVSYSVIQTKFKAAVADSNIDVGFNKVCLHCMRGGGVTYAVRAGAPHVYDLLVY